MERGLKISAKSVIIALFLGLLVNVVYYISLAAINIYTSVILLAFIVLLIKNFKKVEGIKFIIYFALFNLGTLTLFTFSKGITISAVFIFLINAIILLLIVIGLKRLKMWGVYLTIAGILVSIIRLGKILISLQTWRWLPYDFLISNSLAAVFFIIALIYIITIRKHLIKRR